MVFSFAKKGKDDDWTDCGRSDHFSGKVQLLDAWDGGVGWATSTDLADQLSLEGQL